jgi:uncharacterized protein (TIGR00255 family)
MTGFGIGDASLGQGRLVVELRSLNHRFLDVRVRLPAELAEHGFFVEQAVRQRLTRGRFEAGVRLEGTWSNSSGLSLDRAKAAYEVLAALRDEVAPGAELPVSALAAFPDLMAPRSAADTDAVRTALAQAIESAVLRLEEMRHREGESLRLELGRRLAAARHLRDQVDQRSRDAASLSRDRMKERLDRLLSDASVRVDVGRLELELAILADRSDFAEELARLDSHFDQFGVLLGAEDAVGRRLDFLLQEIGREANTIGAKCQDALLSHLIVDLKSEIERMREQVQNVE